MTKNITETPVGPVDIQLPGGVYLKSFPESSANPKFITYSKGREVLVYQVGCDLLEGEYWLMEVRETGPRLREKRELSREESEPILREVLQHLDAAGFTADGSSY